ncbi:MAG TPA: histidine--tRNA ligase [Thermoanaerobaculia bacterium]|nr:histidine--tRNA ligase [Thermoanaerobaculia bacterium]
MTRHAALPGFRDFFPEEMVRRQQIMTVWRQVARRYGFEEYDGPPLEELALYIEKSGPEIVNQLFNFTDKGGREVALRPEMTPTLVRMLGSRIKGLPRPVRWFSTPQLFRYEKQQRGRLREHFQLNMDIIGEESFLADADLLSAALDVLRSLGLTAADVVARVSDRRLLYNALLELGVTEDKLPVAYNVMDKVERDPIDVCVKRLVDLGLSPEKAEAAIGLTRMTLAEIAERYRDNPAVTAVAADLRRYFAALEELGFGAFVQFDMKIVRGLAYYTGIVFEIFDRKGELRAICGGGRYDNLFASLTGNDVPALGFGFGDVVLGELLKDRGLTASVSRSVDYFVIPVNEEVLPHALELAGRLRAAGASAIFPFKAAGVGKNMKAAAAAGARVAIVIGPDEVAAGVVVHKDLESGSETKPTVESLLDEVARRSRR